MAGGEAVINQDALCVCGHRWAWHEHQYQDRPCSLINCTCIRWRAAEPESGPAATVPTVDGGT